MTWAALQPPWGTALESNDADTAQDRGDVAVGHPGTHRGGAAHARALVVLWATSKAMAATSCDEPSAVMGAFGYGKATMLTLIRSPRATGAQQEDQELCESDRMQTEEIPGA